MRKVRNLIIAILSVICVACMFTACAKPSITLDKATIELGWGAQAQIEATLTDSEDTIKWSSSDETVVTVDQNGLVTAVETGTATVTATAGEGKKQVSASCTVTVGEYQLAVTASEESVALLTYGDSTATTKTVTASVVANGATVSDPALTWTSSNNAVAIVNNGVITAVAKGNATITVTATKDGRTATDTIAVSVNKTVVAAPYTASKEYDVRATSISQALESLGLAGYNGTVSVTSTGATVASAAIDGDNLVINATVTAAGTVDYTVEVADRIITLKVTYYELTLALNKEEVALKVSTVNTGDVTSETLTYTASKDGGTIAYASSNDAIATVTNAGVITSVAAGEVTITATYTFDGFTATDSVVVTISKSVVATAYEVSEIVLPVDSKIALTDVGVAESYAGSVALSINGTAVAGATVNAGNVVLPTTGIPAHEQTLVLEFADRVVSVETFIVTHVADSEDTFMAWLNGDRNNTYLRLTGDIALPDKEKYDNAAPSNFTLDGNGKKISGWVESVGILRYGGTNITIKNVTLQNVKASSTIFGHGWKGNCLFENVTLVANMTSTANNRLFFYNASGLNATFKNCNITINVDATKVNNPMFLAASDSNIDSTNTYIFDNTTITSKGVIADVTDNYSFINGSYFTDKNITSEATAITYDAEYVMKADGKFALDLTKLSSAIDLTKVVKMTVGEMAATYVVDGNNITITTENAGYKAVAFESVVNGRLAQTSAKITIATHTAGNIDQVKAWLSASKTNTCLVLTADITFPSSEVLSSGNKDTNVNFTLDGQGHTINGWYESMGLFRYGGRDITIRNIKFTNIKSVDELFGNSWFGTCYLEDIELDAYFTERQNREAILLDDCKEFKLYVNNCNFYFTMPVSYVDTTYYLVSSWSGSFPHPAETSFPIYFNNVNVVTNGTIGTHPANFTFTNCNIVDKSDLVATTYADAYILKSENGATIDLTKLNKTIVPADICMVVIDGVSVPFAVDMTNLVLTTSSAYGEKDVTILTKTGAYKISTIFATNVLSNKEEFENYMKKAHHDTYAVVTADMELDNSTELKGTYSANYTINGLGHSITSIYDYTGLAMGGANNTTIKNITLGIRSKGSAFGDDWLGNNNFINVTLKYTQESSGTPLFARVRANTVMNFTDCTFIISSTNTSTEVTLMQHVNSGIVVNLNNTTIISNGLITALNESYKLDSKSYVIDKADAVATTYKDAYITNVIDLTKLGQDIVPADISVVTVNDVSTPFTVDGTNLTITTSAKGTSNIIIFTKTGALKISVTVANVVISDEASFKTWATAGNSVSGDKYAVVTENITLTADVELNAAWFGGWTLDGLGHTVSNIYDYSGMFEGGVGNITLKNITLNMKTCYSAFGNDWYGTNNFIGVKINVSIPGHAGTSRLLFDGVRADTVFNFTDCEFNFNVSSNLQSNEMLLMKLDNTGIKVNLVNSKIVSTGTIASNAIEACTLDANSSITHRNSPVAYSVNRYYLVDGEWVKQNAEPVALTSNGAHNMLNDLIKYDGKFLNTAKSSALTVGETLDLYYEDGMAVAAVDGSATNAAFYALSSGPVYGTANVSIENIGEYEGKQNVYAYTAVASDVVRIIGVDNSYISANGINSVKMKLWIPTGVDASLIYGTIYNSDAAHGMRLNAANMGGSYLSNYFALYDAEGTRISELAADDYGTWVTLSFELTDIQNNANAAAVNGGLNVEFNLRASATIYIADIQFSTDAIEVIA